MGLPFVASVEASLPPSVSEPLATGPVAALLLDDSLPYGQRPPVALDCSYMPSSDTPVASLGSLVVGESRVISSTAAAKAVASLPACGQGCLNFSCWFYDLCGLHGL